MVIACGEGIGFVPSAAALNKAKEMAGMTSKNWSSSEFEAVANKIDRNDEVLSGICSESVQNLWKTIFSVDKL